MGYKGESSLEFDFEYEYENVKTGLIDLSDLRNVQREMSEQLPHGQLHCGSQTLKMTVLFLTF